MVASLYRVGASRPCPLWSSEQRWLGCSLCELIPRFAIVGSWAARLLAGFGKKGSLKCSLICSCLTFS